MNDILLQTIVEKLQAMEQLLKQDKKNKDDEIVKIILEEIKKASASSISIDKIDELKLSIDKCFKTLEHPAKNQITYKHYLHKGIWIAVVLFFVATFFLWEWRDAINDKRRLEANDVKYRALKISGDKELTKLLYQTDSFYDANTDWMRKYVTQEEDRLTEQTKISQLAGEKKKSVKDLGNRVEKK